MGRTCNSSGTSVFSSLKWNNNSNYLIRILRITWDNVHKVLSTESGLRKPSKTVSYWNVHNTWFPNSLIPFSVWFSGSLSEGTEAGIFTPIPNGKTGSHRVSDGARVKFMHSYIQFPGHISPSQSTSSLPPSPEPFLNTSPAERDQGKCNPKALVIEFTLDDVKESFFEGWSGIAFCHYSPWEGFPWRKCLCLQKASPQLPRQGVAMHH